MEKRPREAALLNVVFSGARGDNAYILDDWIADSSQDSQIVEKAADEVLRQLIHARLGLEFSADTSIEDARQKTVRYVLLAEFRNDLQGDAPQAVNMVPRPGKKDELELALDIAIVASALSEEIGTTCFLAYASGYHGTSKWAWFKVALSNRKGR